MDSPDQNLDPILSQASNEDLEPLVEYILKAEITERLSNHPRFKIYRPDHSKYWSVIRDEILLFGGNTFVNMVRDGGPDYFEIVCDVARRRKADFDKNSSIKEVELAILVKILGEAWEKMSDEERRAIIEGITPDYVGAIPKAFPLAAIQIAIRKSGFLAYRCAVMVSNAVAKAILGRGLALAANAALTKWISLFAGPIGWVVTTIWTLIDIASPASRVIDPCVVHIAYLRHKQLIALLDESDELPTLTCNSTDTER